MAQLIEEMSAGPARVRVDVIGREVPEHVLENMDFLNYRLARGPPPPERPHRAPFPRGESTHGKSMGQIEACRRGGQLISTETTVIDEDGIALVGSKTVFIKSRAKGTERADKAAPEAGVAKFFGEMPTWEEYLEPSNIDVVIVPSIDGNYAASTVPMIPFERQFQSLHSLQNYLHLNELLAPGWPMPIMDSEELRRRRAAFLERFCTRPYYLLRAAPPQALRGGADER